MPHFPGHTPLTAADVGESLRPLIEGQPGQSPLTLAAIEQFRQAQLPIIQGQLALQGLSGSPALSMATAQGLGQALPQFIGQDIQNRLQAAQLGLGSGQLELQKEIQRGQLGLQEEIERGQLEVGRGQLGLQEEIGRGQLGLQEEIERGQLGVQRGQLGLQREIGRGQLGLQEEIQRGQLGVQRGQLGVQQRGQALQEFTQPFGLGLEQRRVGIQEFAVPEQLAQSGIGLAASIANQQKMRELQASQQAGQLQLGYGSQIGVPLAQLESSRQLAAIQALGALGGQQQGVQQAGFNAQQAERDRLQGIAAAPTLGIFGGAGIAPAIKQAQAGK